MWKPKVFVLPNGSLIQIKQYDDDNAIITFYDSNEVARDVPPEIVVYGELSKHCRSTHGIIYITLLDNYTISFNDRIVLSLKNQWHIKSSLPVYT